MDFQHIRGFVSVAENESVSRAAHNLYITQPALSRQIIHLEEELGVRLFARTAGRMTLTRAGRRFLPEAHRILRDIDDAIASTGKRKQNLLTLRIGYIPALMYAFIADSLISYSKQHRDIAITMCEGSPTQQLQMLRDHNIDIACTSRIRADDLNSQRLARVPIVQVVPISYRPSMTDSPPLVRLHKETFISLDRNQYPHEEMIVRRVCRDAGFEPSLLEMDSVTSVLTSIALEQGIGVMPAHFHFMEHPGVRFESLPFITPDSDILAVTQKHKIPAYVQDFIETLKKAARIRYMTKFWQLGDQASEKAFATPDRRSRERRKVLIEM